MALIWLLPAALTLTAVAASVMWLRAISEEAERLRGELRTLPLMAERARSVRAQTDRMAASTDAAADYFGNRARK